MAMVPEVKTLLLDALRSGEYQKTIRRLARLDESGNMSYCCLGVLTDLAAKKGICNPLVPHPDLDNNLGVRYEHTMEDGYKYSSIATCYLPKTVEKWSGLTEADQTQLAQINDSNRTFDKVIEFLDINL
ncbi:MAG TPA: hypothetical protein VIY48_00040 [Candidatus Paceibacterota bacterium]